MFSLIYLGISRIIFERAERLLHKELLESRARFQARYGCATEFTAALKRFAALIVEGTIPDVLNAEMESFASSAKVA